MFAKLVVLAAILCVAFGRRVQMETPKLGLTQPRLASAIWKRNLEASASSKDGKIRLTFALKQQNIDLLDKKLMEVSTPSSPAYGKHLTLEEINKLSQPKGESIDAVTSFLKSFGVADYEYSSGFLRVTVPVTVAEKMLDTEYHSFTHKTTGHSALRCDSYTLPEEVAKAVSFVSPTVTFPATSFKPSSAIKAEVADGVEVYQNTPEALRALYKVGSTQGARSSKNRQAATAFLDQYYEETDLQAFYKKYYPTLSGVPFANVVGPNGKRGGIEAALDVEYISVLGSGVPSEFWSFAGSQPDNEENEPFLDWLYLLGNTTDVPYVFSTSYGEDEWSVSYDYASRMNEEFLKGGLRGISFLFASGDSGVGSAFGSCTTYTPMFPSDSPYVTAVGATTSTNPETGASLSSGGFSNRWAQPSWQSAAVAHYLSTGPNMPAANLYNATGRAFPDVSAQGTDYPVINNGVTYPAVAGTSASCPVFGGIVGLVNDARVSAGKAPLGFLNPFLYSYASAFTDITSGNNPGCGTKGFTASAGWDPVTGLGTPNYASLVEAALALP